MAITDTLGQTINNSNNVATYPFLAFTPAANDIIVVATAITDTAANLAISDTQPLVWTELVNQVWGTSQKMGLWVSSLAAAVSTTVTITCTGDNGTGCVAFARRIAGGRTTAPFHAQASFGTGVGGTTPTVVMPGSFNTNNAGFGFAFNLRNPATLTQSTGWSELIDVGHTTPDVGGQYQRILSGETAGTIAWGGTSTVDWGAMVVEIYEASQGPTGIIPRIMHHRNQMGANN